MEPMTLLRTLVALALLAWLPGYAWTRALFPTVKGVERFAWSVGLSVASVTLALYAGSVLFSWPVGARTAAWSALAIALAGFALPAGRALDRALAPRIS